MNDEDLQRVYQWVDEIPLSRPKRNIARDFSDGVLTAEIVAHYFPKLIEVHNYPPANSFATKNYNWKTLNDKPFKKMHFSIKTEEINDLCNCVPQAVEKMLMHLQTKMAAYGARKTSGEPEEVSVVAKPYKPPPKPEARAPTVPKGPAAARATKASGAAVANAASAHPTGAAHYDVGDGQLTHLLTEKDNQLAEARETVSILEVKIQKLEQLVRLKDSKIAALTAKLQQE